MKSNLAPKDISLDLNITSLQIKFDAPIPDSLVIEWARGMFFTTAFTKSILNFSWLKAQLFHQN